MINRDWDRQKMFLKRHCDNRPWVSRKRHFQKIFFLFRRKKSREKFRIFHVPQWIAHFFIHWKKNFPIFLWGQSERSLATIFWCLRPWPHGCHFCTFTTNFSPLTMINRAHVCVWPAALLDGVCGKLPSSHILVWKRIRGEDVLKCGLKRGNFSMVSFL